MKTRRLFWNIVNNVEALIDSGVYSAGSRLPPERELAEMYDVSRPTIREAIIALEVRERVEVKTGSGVYVTAQHTSAFAEKIISAFELAITPVILRIPFEMTRAFSPIVCLS